MFVLSILLTPVAFIALLWKLHTASKKNKKTHDLQLKYDDDDDSETQVGLGVSDLQNISRKLRGMPLHIDNPVFSNYKRNDPQAPG